MVDSTSPVAGRAGRAAGRLLVAAGLVVAGLFVGTGVSAADVSAANGVVVSPTNDTVSDTPLLEDPSGCRIG